jgi:uncharacterized protein YhaN
MKTKIAIDVPTREQLLAGLDPRALYPALGKAERAVTDGEQLVERRRRELAAAERLAVELPARVNRGEAAPSALVDALRAREAAVLLLEQASNALPAARARVLTEELNANLAVVAEIDRRSGPITRATADLAPAVAEIEMLEGELAVARNRAQQAAHTARTSAILAAADARHGSRHG